MSEPGSPNNGDQLDNVVDNDANLHATARPSDGAKPSDPEVARAKKKRRKQEDISKPNRLKGLYNDEYRILLNSTITDATSGTLLELANPEDSVVGVSKWTVAEKQAFFRGLDKYGRDNVPSIAALIQTKSLPEVRDFLLLLQKSLVNLHRHNSHPHQPALHEFPAAIELSEECCKNLDTAGAALAWYQDTYEARREQEKHGDYWLLTPELGELVEERVQAAEAGKKDQSGASGSEDDEDGAENAQDQEVDAQDSNHGEEDVDEEVDEVLDAVPAARLFHLKRWIELIGLFSANARSEESWNLDTSLEEKLGIYYKAFEDFHRLAVSVTQRLVTAIIFQATNRLRMTEDYIRVGPYVRRIDVFAAVDVLGLPRSSWDFWIKTPRRLGLQVSKGKGKQKRNLSYDEMELELSRPYGKKRPRRGEIWKPEVDVVSEHGQAQPNGENTNHDLSDMSDTYLDGIDVTDSEPDPDDPYTQHVEYAERVDQQQSRREERKLWKMLGQDPPPGLLPKPQELPQKPWSRRKTQEELADWRDVLDFKSPWERYGEPVEEREFVAVQQRMQARRARRRERMERRAGQEGDVDGEVADRGGSSDHLLENPKARSDETADEEGGDSSPTGGTDDEEMGEAEAAVEDDDEVDEKEVDGDTEEEAERMERRAGQEGDVDGEVADRGGSSDHLLENPNTRSDETADEEGGDSSPTEGTDDEEMGEAEAAVEDDDEVNEKEVDGDTEEEAETARQEIDEVNEKEVDPDAEEEEEQESSEESVDQDTATNQAPTRRQLQPRRARESARNSISATPVFPYEDEASDSEDDFRPLSPEV